MSLKCGIVGLPNVGKSTLFNALTKAGIAAVYLRLPQSVVPDQAATNASYGPRGRAWIQRMGFLGTSGAASPASEPGWV